MGKPKCIGILGGGQLARMSLFAGKRLGFDIAILEKESGSPAGQLTHLEFTGSPINKTLLKKFSACSDVITLENEFIDYKILEYIENLGTKVLPSSETISLIQDKLIQKETLKKNNIPVPNFIAVNSKTDFNKAAEFLKLPFILKSRKMGYDGYGNALIKNKRDFDKSFDKLTRRHSKLMAEQFVKFTKELAVMIARTENETAIYPVAETIQKDHICHTVIAPAEISTIVYKKARQAALIAVKAVKGFGLFGIELFLTNTGKILVNEMAPRPHNSGHYTIENCISSQFENHIRSVLGLPLGSTEMIKQCAVMINLLGKTNTTGEVKNYKQALSDQCVHLHVYGKKLSRIGRKMGHITVTGDDRKKVLLKAKKSERKIII
ncbi:MAG: 5-(carboxyamino)imidazole ribonucleotide synthase [Ignavibacteria bacterium]|nr:5-(carboxyamino)imidazole ribonucleotide synthase [Ignavibacteria bacterium]